MQKAMDETEYFYNDDLEEFERLNTTTKSIYELGDLKVLIILNDGQNLTDYLDIENPEDVIFISEDLSGLGDADSYYYLGKVVRRQYGGDDAVFNWYGENPFKNVRAIVCQGLTGEVTSLNQTFLQLDNLTTISGLDTWDVSNVCEMRSLFANCSNLTTLHGLDIWDVGNVSDMGWTFKYCKNLKDISFLESWDVGNAEFMKGMFLKCGSLENVDSLKGWDVGNVYDMSFMFYGCRSLFDISALDGWEVPSLKEMEGMFDECPIFEDASVLKSWNMENEKDEQSNRSSQFDGKARCIYCGSSNLVLDSDLICRDCSSVVLKSSEMKCPDCGGEEMVYDSWGLWCRKCGLIILGV